MKNIQITTTLNPGLYDAWTRWTAARGIQKSTGIRNFIEHLTQTHPPPKEQREIGKRGINLTAKVSDETVKRIKIRMEIDGIPTISAWARAVIVAASGQDILTQTERADLNNARMEVRRVGVNLNQIARRLNTDTGDGDQERADIEAAIREAKSAISSMTREVEKFHKHTKIRWRGARVGV